jgi:hypothetical protein
VTPPAVRIVFELEAPPRVEADWLTDAEDARMVDWLDSHPIYQALIAAAVELTERERAT